jgi:hypothetical protein
MERAAEGVEKIVSLDEETLELDELNSHECMVRSLCLYYLHAFDLHIFFACLNPEANLATSKRSSSPEMHR